MNKLDQYILDHISPEDPVLEDLNRQTHIRFINPNMISGHLQGKFLEFIAGMIRPINILEIGTFTGYSAICLARGLKPGGKLVTIDINDELNTFTDEYFVRAGVDKKITRLNGNAIELIPELKMKFDLVYIDGDKREYCDYFRVAIDKINREGIIIADNVLWGGQVLDKTGDPQAAGIIRFNEMIKNDENLEKVIIPLRDGMMIIRRKGE